ncbi:hypothetical protein GO755_38525 [Spirosoma sp. HMF4905]|uniref:histidine kinase n=2 Tax=Spirosoma arboris TaxID=2682092 RepID=A0A7K1SQJ9_9BACT|nr:hypothetical protein [Spirosoma arboris]
MHFCLWQTLFFAIMVSLNLFGYRIKYQWLSISILIAFSATVIGDQVGGDTVISIANILQQLFYVSLIIYYWKRLKGAQWAIVSGLISSNVFSILYAISVFRKTDFDFYLNFTGIALSLPVAFLVYIALRFKETLTEIQQQATAVLQVTEEKNQLLATQNERLEAQVEARTAELKASQTQLIQKEKLASLGELTAGIAHEIQNPLNFVNNFSEVSTELIDELKQEAQAGNTDEVMAIADDLTSNLQKINHHGNRASSIVKGMLEHSRTESGEKRPTDLNALADEYFQIAYYGLKAKDKVGFNCELITEFDPALEPVEVAPQEIGRVLLNLYNNAFYAVAQRASQNHNADYKPTVWVSTSQVSGQEIIRVRDNGTGIPKSVKAKIFQPFFTTKPTGEGTGLGLSLSYDIITKGHGGTLLVDSHQGEGTEFRIELPITKPVVISS